MRYSRVLEAVYPPSGSPFPARLVQSPARSSRARLDVGEVEGYVAAVEAELVASGHVIGKAYCRPCRLPEAVRSASRRRTSAARRGSERDRRRRGFDRVRGDDCPRGRGIRRVGRMARPRRRCVRPRRRRIVLASFRRARCRQDRVRRAPRAGPRLDSTISVRACTRACSTPARFARGLGEPAVRAFRRRLRPRPGIPATRGHHGGAASRNDRGSAVRPSTSTSKISSPWAHSRALRPPRR